MPKQETVVFDRSPADQVIHVAHTVSLHTFGGAHIHSYPIGEMSREVSGELWSLVRNQACRLEVRTDDILQFAAQAD